MAAVVWTHWRVFAVAPDTDAIVTQAARLWIISESSGCQREDWRWSGLHFPAAADSGRNAMLGLHATG